MGYTIEKSLPKADKVLQDLPLDPSLAKQVIQDQQEIADILTGKDDRKIMIIGPCSAWPSEAVIEFAEKLKPTVDKVSDKLKIVLRVYLQKPRTTVGWMGPVNQPDPFTEPDLEAGTYYSRKMMIEAVKLGYAIADEALFTHNDSYFVDLLSWIAIGARSAEDQEHRIFASMIPHPVGLKNPTSGDLKIGVNSVIASQFSHTFAFHGKQIKTNGNPYAHLILRGGNGLPNYNIDKIKQAAEILHEKELQNPAIIVDLSHDNCICPTSGKKDPLLQPKILNEILDSLETDALAKKTVKGFMAESFLLDGNQNAKKANSAEELAYGQSITDGCLGLEKTIAMLEEVAERL